MTEVRSYLLEPEIDLEMPKDAEIICVAGQGSRIYLWANVEPDAETEVRHFRGFGEGHYVEQDPSLHFRGTALMHGGTRVFQIYEQLAA